MADRLNSLLSSDYDVEVVRDGAALVASATRRMADVIVSDVVMPGVSGIAATGRILAEDADARIVLVSVRDEPAIIAKALAAGALGYVLKSDAGEDLPIAIAAALAGRRFLSSSAQRALDRSRAVPTKRED